MERLSRLAFKPVQCSNAHEFMSALSPFSPLWEQAPSDWIFRGHADSTWSLLPTALRPGGLRDHKTGTLLLASDTPIGALDVELAGRILMSELLHVKKFFEICDSHGLLIPGDSYEHRTIEGLAALAEEMGRAIYGDSLANPSPWPPGAWLYVYALAQHYGIQTRLIDWTRKSRVAAYFAARKIAEEITKSAYTDEELTAKNICVWGINKSKIQLEYPLALPEEPSCAPRIRFITAPQVSNPNLSAQAGLFTVDTDPKRRIPLDKLILDGLDRITDESIAARISQNPLFIVKLELPYRHARELLRLLAAEAVTAASVFPGYHGAASALTERTFWQ